MKYILLFSFFIFQLQSVTAQECRSPTGKEQHALNKLVTTMDDNFTSKLVDDDWQLQMETGKDILVARVPFARPLMFCDNAYRADFKLNESSPLYSRLNDSANYYMDLSSKTDDGTRALQLMEKYTAFLARENYGFTVY
jgi:hypothetical protein